MQASLAFINQLSLPGRLLALVLLAALAHLLVRLIKTSSAHWASRPHKIKKRKLMSLISLISSSLIFLIYFTVTGFILTEFGVPIGAYLASASIIGLAVGFGSQGLVQDIVSGMTSIFSDVLDVGDLVEINGQVGLVKQIGLRFLQIENSMGARVLIPNRSLNHVINYKRGYVRCLVDVTLPESDVDMTRVVDQITKLADSVYSQYPGIHLAPPSVLGEIVNESGRRYLRIKFRIWPGRGTPIENNFKPEVNKLLKKIDPGYATWMISVHYEVESKA